MRSELRSSDVRWISAVQHQREEDRGWEEGKGANLYSVPYEDDSRKRHSLHMYLIPDDRRSRLTRERSASDRTDIRRSRSLSPHHIDPSRCSPRRNIFRALQTMDGMGDTRVRGHGVRDINRGGRDSGGKNRDDATRQEDENELADLQLDNQLDKRHHDRQNRVHILHQLSDSLHERREHTATVLAKEQSVAHDEDIRKRLVLLKQVAKSLQRKRQHTEEVNKASDALIRGERFTLREKERRKEILAGLNNKISERKKKWRQERTIYSPIFVSDPSMTIHENTTRYSKKDSSRRSLIKDFELDGGNVKGSDSTRHDHFNSNYQPKAGGKDQVWMRREERTQVETRLLQPDHYSQRNLNDEFSSPPPILPLEEASITLRSDQRGKNSRIGGSNSSPV
jgi:hypothetical protein